MLEVDPAAGGLGDGQARVEVLQCPHHAVGDCGRLDWVAVLVLDLDHALLAGLDAQVLLEGLAGVDRVFFIVVTLKVEVLDELVLDRAGLDHGDVDVAGVLAHAHDAAPHAPEEREGRRLADHRRQDAGRCGVL